MLPSCTLPRAPALFPADSAADGPSGLRMTRGCVLLGTAPWFFKQTSHPRPPSRENIFVSIFSLYSVHLLLKTANEGGMVALYISKTVMPIMIFFLSLHAPVFFKL